jgi:hypothetical protein
MSTSIRMAMLCTFVSISVHCAIVTQWNFNSNPSDDSTSSGTNVPSIGTGTALLIGDVTATFATGSTNDPATSADDSGWNTRGYPDENSGNKTAGAEFRVSTLGFSNIVVRWDHKVSGGASKYCRLQYSTDGVSFIDYPTPVSAQVVSTTASYFEAQTNSLEGFVEVHDNANFAFRIVSEFESTAAGGVEAHVTTAGASYSTAGTIRLDLVTVLGTPIPGANTPPNISSVSNQTLRVNQSTAALLFIVGDSEDPATSLNVEKSSSDPNVIPDSNIHLDGSAASRTVTVSAGPQTGTSIINLTVIDTGGRSNSTAFAVTVLPLNTAPLISSISPTNTLINQPAPALDFTVSDLEAAAADLIVTGSSANTLLVPNGNIAFGGSGSNRNVTITPANGQAGVVPITLTVSDGFLSSSTSFAVMVLPSANALFYDPFAYTEGSLVTNSAFLWETRSGTDGECQVIDGQLQVTGTQSEDVTARLAGSPYVRSNSTVLYASFKLKAVNLPKTTPGYFAHFSSGNANRGRVYAGVTNSTPGAFRLFVANGSDDTTMLPADLNTNVTYQVVTRYEIDTATTTLWLDPSSESDLHVTAADLLSSVSISSYGFRQDASLGATLLVDDLRVGLSFSDVVVTGINPIPLDIQRRPGEVVLTWSDSAFGLQSAPIPEGVYTNILGATSPYTNGITDRARFFRLKFK